MSLFRQDNHIVLWWLALGTLSSNSTEPCQLPSPLQSSSWNYAHTSRELTLNFGTSTMSGFWNKFRGEEIKDYDCISNTNNVYIFKSQDTFSNRGDIKRLFLCMKMTMASSNLFYFYLLADIETGSNIEPNPERVYIANEGLSDALPTCDYCLYTTSPPDDDFRILRRSGQSSENLSGNVSICLPCDATCTSTPVSCGTPPVVSHTSNVNTGTDYDDTITYTCLSGYEKTSGNLVRTCQADENWSGSPPVCSPVSCGSLGAVSHTTTVPTGIYYTNTITYTCVSGYEHTSGTLIRTCQASRNWNGSPPVCNAVLPTTNEEVAMITTGTTSGSILLVVIVFMVVCLFLKCRAQKNSNLNSKKRSRYTRSYIQNVYNI